MPSRSKMYARILALLLLSASSPMFAQVPMQAVGQASNQFGFELYRKMQKADAPQNAFMSPFSVFSALAMTAEGAGNSTLSLFQKILHLPEKPTLHEGLLKLGEALNRKDAPYAIALANAIWPEKSVHLRPEFLAVIQRVYLGASIPQDYILDYEGARKTINAWVEMRTNGHIKDLLYKGSLSEETRLVLTNAIFFKGNWKIEFEKKLTTPQPFYLDNGQSVDAPLMSLPHDRSNYLGYFENQDYQAVELPYEGDELSMVVLLPQKGKMGDLEKQLDHNLWNTVCQNLRQQEVDVWLPKFKMELGGSIKDELSALGLKPLFTLADFSPMFVEEMPLKIDDVVHKAFVEVNEEGTEAAAATAVVIGITTSVGGNFSMPHHFRADHPFLFMIRHRPSNTVLFMGKVMDPTKK